MTVTVKDLTTVSPAASVTCTETVAVPLDTGVNWSWLADNVLAAVFAPSCTVTTLGLELVALE